MVDAAIATKVAVNWNGMKNQLGAFYEPILTIIDFNFLHSIPVSEIRNGVAEIIKVAALTHLHVFELIEGAGDSLLNSKFCQVKDYPANPDETKASEIILMEGMSGMVASKSCC
jgi:3-dehydroquinate synthetase